MRYILCNIKRLMSFILSQRQNLYANFEFDKARIIAKKHFNVQHVL